MIQAYDLPDLLSRLVDRSLVSYDQESRRYALLETVRQYATEHALNLGDSVVAREAHAAYFSELAKDAHIKVRGPQQMEWLRIFDTEYDNIRLALEWRASSSDHMKQALKVAFNLLDYWLVRGYYHEIAFWVAKFREQADIVDDEDVAELLLLEESHAQFTGLPRGDIADRALESALRSGNESLLAQAYCIKAFGKTQERDEAGAKELIDKAVPLLRKHGDATMEAFLHMNLGNLCFVGGRFEQARSEYLHALQIRRVQKDTRGLGASIGGLAEVAEALGELELSSKLWRYSLASFKAAESRWDIAGCLPGLCNQLRNAGDMYKAAQVLGCADALQEQIGSGRDIADSSVYERHRAALEGALTPEEFERAYLEGRRTTWQKMIQTLYPEGLALPSPKDLESIVSDALKAAL